MGRKLGWTPVLSAGFGEIWVHLWRVKKLSMRPTTGRTEEVSFPSLGAFLD